MTLVERLQKSIDLHRKIKYPHKLKEIANTDGLVECIVCGGCEGTLLHDCPGVECGDLLDEVYRSTNMTDITRHWHVLLIRANKKRDEEMLSLIRSIV